MYASYEQIKRKNPRENANWLSFLTFGYTLPLFKKGFEDKLQETDIYEVPDECASKLCGDKAYQNWQDCKTTLELLLRRFGRRYFLYTFIHLTWLLLHGTIHPYALSRFISYFEKSQTQYSRNDAFYYGGVVIFLSIFQSLWIHNYYVLECTLGIRIRCSLTSLIYRKVVKMGLNQSKSSSMGNIVTVLTKDIRTIETTIWALSDMLIGCIRLVYISCLLYFSIGSVSFLATGSMIIIMTIQILLSRFILKLRLRVGKLADKRLRFTKEILTALKTIKMYTWEAFFHDRVCEARKKETKANVRTWCLGAVITFFGTVTGKLLFPSFLSLYMYLGHSINVELIYYMMSLFRDLSNIIAFVLPAGFGLSAEFYASVIRIGRALATQEALIVSHEKCPPNAASATPHSDDHFAGSIKLENVSLSLDGTPVLDNITIDISNPGLRAVTGPLTSGKSLILKVILQEYPASSGQVSIAGNVSYTSQEAWLFPATVRQNILFGRKFDRERYEKIVQNCCLERDFAMLPNADDTIVIDGGLNLSKGQQARINLARCLYRESNIYLLDDPLAFLDVKVQDNIFKNCILDLSKNKIVILVTQNDKHLRQARTVIVMDHGQMRSVIERDDVAPFKGDSHEIIQANHGTQAHKASVKIYKEDKNAGGVSARNYYSYIKYGGGLIVFMFLLSLFLLTQATESYSEKLLSQWVDRQAETVNKTLNLSMSQEERQFVKDNTFDLYIVMIIASSAIDLLKYYFFVLYCRQASIKFHKSMARSVINCKITFLDNHFIGNILNRFSYDLDHIDEVFPFVFKDVITNIFAIGGTLVLIATIDWSFFFITILFFSTLAVLRRLYIPTARTLKRLAAMTRSPFVGHLNASIDGLSIIKAFEAEDLLIEEFDKHQDLAISVAYMEMIAARAFGFALDLDCSLFITAVILTMLFMDLDVSVGNVGLALSQVFALSTTLQWIVRLWAELEQCMTSVERVTEYIEIPQEEIHKRTAPPNWPDRGTIKYQQVNLHYGFEQQVLKNVDFEINPGEKVAVIGRTGAGKSSLVSTLLRLYDYNGTIWIDGVDIKEVPLNCLRRSISLIPQDPLIFAGTVRENLDPYGFHLDKDMWKVLKSLNLLADVTSLDANVSDLALSLGQLQLISLARVLLSDNQIVVIDEATANLDADTDTLVQNLMMRHFDRCTVIMIAHRLQSTLNCDKVMVMDFGEIVEFDEPHVLLENHDSLYYQMINNEIL